MNDSTLYPELPSAPPICTEELDCSANRSQLTIIIETPVSCGKDNIPKCSNCCIKNQDCCAEESKTKDTKKQPIIKFAWKTYMACFICFLGFFLLSLPFFIFALVKPKDGSYWIN